jgi:hypothetical protein
VHVRTVPDLRSRCINNSASLCRTVPRNKR